MIQSNDKYIISYRNEFRIYNKSTLAFIKTVQEPNVRIFQIFNTFILFTNDSGLFLYSISKDSKMEIVLGFKIESIFIKDSFIYAGFENGNLNVYSYNEHLAKMIKSYKHPGPIKSIASDNVKIYVADIRNKVTVYPDQISFDFADPIVLFKKYPYTLSDNKLYAHTQESNGLVLEFNFRTESVQFGPSGGTIFAFSNGFVSIFDTLGNPLGKFMANDFTVIERNGKCLIVEEKNDKLETQETYVIDFQAPEYHFPKSEIIKKVLTTEDYERKYVYVDDGNKKSLPRSIKKEKTNKRAVIDESSSYEDESYSTIDRGKQSLIYESSEELSIPKNQFFNPVLVTKNPSSYENTEGKLLFYSSQGFMISLESAVSNQIFVKFHDRSQESYEIKDPLKCHLGSFFGRDYVISDGKTINFSGIWTKEIPCSLLGLSRYKVFVFDKNILTVLDHSGRVIDTFYIKDAYSFCSGENSLAIFCKDFLMILNETNTDYIPCSGIEFGCFENEELFVKIENKLFTVVNRLLKYLIDVNERPLTVYDNNVVVLAENTILPRPVVKFYPIKPDFIEQVDIDSYKVGKYDPTAKY